jgi:hypothetical protein
MNFGDGGFAPIRPVVERDCGPVYSWGRANPATYHSELMYHAQ